MTIADQEPTFAPGFGPEGAKPNSGEQKQGDYFGFQRTEKFSFPDGVSYIEYRALNEGAKKQFQDKTSRDLVVERSGNARMSILQGSERHELIKAACVDWNLSRNGQPVAFSKMALDDFLQLADPVLVEDLEKAIRKANPWLLADMKVEDIDKEIANLEEMRAEAVKREQGEAS